MAQLESRLSNYVESITGELPDLQRESSVRVAGLPLFLRDRYRLYSIRLLGRKCLLALETADREAASPVEYRSHATALQAKLGEPVAVVVPTLPAYARNRMVRSGVPFIVPGNQMFLPFLMLDLRERFPRPPTAAVTRLTPAAQCILLYHLLRDPLDHLPLREIASRVGYSAMMLTRARDELEAARLCESSRKGRSIVLRFPDSGRVLWDRAEPVLSSPVNRTQWVQWENPGPPALAAGLTALSRRTLIEDDRVPTYALLHETYRASLDQGVFRGCPDPSEASVRLESWSYNPSLLSKEPTVDRLSLYLSLRESSDERVQQQLERLIGEVSW